MQHLKVARWAVVVAAAALAAGCPRPATGAAAGGDVRLRERSLLWERDVATATESQRALSHRFFTHDLDEGSIQPCVDVGDDGELEPADTERRILVSRDEEVLAIIDEQTGNRLEWHPTEPPTTFAGIGESYFDPEQDTAVIFLEGLAYILHDLGTGGAADFKFSMICALLQNEQELRGRSLAVHRDVIVAYIARRIPVAAAEAEASAVAAAADAEHEAELEANAQADLARARTMESITVEAGGNSPNEGVWIAVTAQLADGTSMVIRYTARIFDQLFTYEYVSGDYEFMIEVFAKDDASIHAETGEVAFSFADEHRFECQGAVGASGLDTDWNGAMYYTGRRGDDGPALTVEIASTGARTSDGDQILRYRLSCQDRTEVFTASASALVDVATTGGKGGHGVPRAYGETADGSDGGNGGDGGVITVIVDPSVEAYNLTLASRGGAGGNPSEETDAARAGTRGNPGTDSPISKESAAVEIP